MRTHFVDMPRTESLRALNYAPALERIRKAGSTASMPLRTLVKGFGPSYGAVFTRLDCDAAHGVRLLSQTDTFAAEPLGRIIRKDSMLHPDRHVIRRWQVLISGAGQMGEGNLFGRSVIADGRLEGAFLGPDTFALEFEEPGSDINLWTYAVLNSSFGSQAVSASAYGTSIPHLRADLLADTPIPVPPSDLLKKVARLIRKTVEEREKFLICLTQARALVEKLPEMLHANELCATRRRQAVMWDGPLPTLVAWNAASSGGALNMLREKWHANLGDVTEADGIYYGHRFSRVDCRAPHGVDFMSQRDAMYIRPAPRRIVHPGFPDKQLFAKENTILVGGQGTLGEGEIFGRASLVHGRYTKAAYTEHLLRVIPKQSRALALYAYLTTTVGFRLLRTTAVGTKILGMREDLLRALPVPEWPLGVEQTVGQLVSNAFMSRDAADSAEEEAIQLVEQEVLPTWLA